MTIIALPAPHSSPQGRLMLKFVQSITVVLLATVVGTAWRPLSAQDAIDYRRQIRPLLSDRCYKCHGPDGAERQAGLRLDLREDALGSLDSGNTAVVPGNAAASALVSRIRSTDPDQRMPP